MLESLHHTISQKVAEIFDLYTELHDIHISLFSPDGRLIYPDSVGRPNCQHCMMLRNELNMDDKCRELDRKMMHVALEKQDMISYTCHAGMREATVPILVDGELAGYVMLGQFRSETAPPVSPYAQEWNAIKGDDGLQAAFEKTPEFPEHKIEILLCMFRHLLEFMVGGHLIHHKDYDLIEPVIERIHDRPDVDLGLDEAAAIVGRSPSTVSRLFRKVAGCSFKQYQIDYRLRLAADQLKSMPNRPVADIANAVGYEDPLYFSRVFRKHIGCAPTEYRHRQFTE